MVDLSHDLQNVFLVFCRIGCLLILVPGFSSQRVPMLVRLALAIWLAVAVSSLHIEQVPVAKGISQGGNMIAAIVTECAVGGFLGFLARFLFHAIQFAATAVSNFIGLGGIPGAPLEDSETTSPLPVLASSAAVMMIFGLDLHLQMLEGVIGSYDVVPVGGDINGGATFQSLSAVLSDGSLLALQLMSPFIAYGIVVNLALALGNRFATQLSVYHATTGAVMLGGMFLLLAVWPDWMRLFLSRYENLITFSWLS